MTWSKLPPVVAAVVLSLFTAACGAGPELAQGGPFGSGANRGEDVLLTVQNNDFRDATVYAYWNGVKNRVGMVTGKTSETFRTRWRSEDVQLEVDFVGGGGFGTERVQVYEGDHLDFVIPIGP